MFSGHELVSSRAWSRVKGEQSGDYLHVKNLNQKLKPAEKMFSMANVFTMIPLVGSPMVTVPSVTDSVTSNAVILESLEESIE